MLAGSALTAAATVASWVGLVALGALRAAEVSVSPRIQLAAAVVAAPIVLAAALRTALAVSRGPPVVAFERDDAVACKPAHAGAIRAAAQLRGTMGGAGHVHPTRLALPLMAWVAALAAGAEAVFPAVLAAGGAWPIIAAVSAALAAFVFPSRPFWYREVTGGGVLVSPPVAAALVVARILGSDTGARAAEPDRET